ncbi:hypothetical protein Tco_0402053 [Tanacetum coccineum]
MQPLKLFMNGMAVGQKSHVSKAGKVTDGLSIYAWLMISRCSRSLCQIQVQGTSSNQEVNDHNNIFTRESQEYELKTRDKALDLISSMSWILSLPDVAFFVLVKNVVIPSTVIQIAMHRTVLRFLPQCEITTELNVGLQLAIRWLGIETFMPVHHKSGEVKYVSIEFSSANDYQGFVFVPDCLAMVWTGVHE